MDFAFSAEQIAIRETARRFAQTCLLPHYKARENAGHIDLVMAPQIQKMIIAREKVGRVAAPCT
ncbi:MAG: hypothetical protein EXR86_03270 [Gammaproteobacteria bacterium]|nr:hypothetical protein [Gammaproteobacteria bacterium]